MLTLPKVVHEMTSDELLIELEEPQKEEMERELTTLKKEVENHASGLDISSPPDI